MSENVYARVGQQFSSSELELHSIQNDTFRVFAVNQNLLGNTTRPCAYKTFFMLNSAELEISKLDKSNLINLLDKLLTSGDFHCFCLSNRSFKINLPHSLKDKLGIIV